MSAEQDLSAVCARAFRRDHSAKAVLYEGRWYDWGFLTETADRLSDLIRRSGLQYNAPIAFISRNRPWAVAVLLRVVQEQRNVRMVYAFQSPAAIARDLERLNPRLVIAGAEDWEGEVRAAVAALGAAAISYGETGLDLMPGHETATPLPEDDLPAERHIAILTSGTTGPPKQFPVSYEMISRHIVRAPEALQAPDKAGENPPPLLFFPLGNISGLYSTLPAMLIGGWVELVDRFSIDAWHAHVVRFKPAHTGLPPTMIQMVLDRNIPKEDLASIKTLGTGAAPLDPNVQRAFEDRYGIPILLSYGATEFGGPVTAMTAELHAQFGRAKLGTVGRPIGGAKIRVVDPETGAELPASQEGLLEVVSPRIGPDWIRTADLAMIDEDGFLFHRGRADGAIMRGGFKVLPEVIERALLLHPAVAAVSVVGVPDRRLGQVPGAALQLRPEAARPGLDEIEAHLRNHVPATHVPAHWAVVDELPKNPSMKIDRPAVTRLFTESKGADHAA